MGPVVAEAIHNPLTICNSAPTSEMVKNSGGNNINHVQTNEKSVKLNLVVNTGYNYPFADGTALISDFRFAVLFA